MIRDRFLRDITWGGLAAIGVSMGVAVWVGGRTDNPVVGSLIGAAAGLAAVGFAAWRSRRRAR